MKSVRPNAQIDIITPFDFSSICSFSDSLVNKMEHVLNSQLFRSESDRQISGLLKDDEVVACCQGEFQALQDKVQVFVMRK